MSLKVEQIKGCRICGCKQLEVIFDLGQIYPSNFILQDADSADYDKAPLTLVQCPNCDLVQLKYSVEPDVMYKTQYWYKSNLNKSMVTDLKDIVENIESRIELNNKDLVIDIGCNDGTLFKQYTNPVLNKVGFDPALNIREVAESNCTLFVNDYFGKVDLGEEYFIPNMAKVVTSIAMFYDLPNPNQFVSDVKKVLHSDGIWVIQMTDLVSMLLLNAVDNICHEHLEYYSLHVLNNLLRKHDLEIFDLEWNTVNGGSLRTYVCHKGVYPISENVEHGLAKEYLILNSTLGTFKAFKSRINVIHDTVLDFLVLAQCNGYKVYGMGASTKGNTLLQYFQIQKELLPKIVEVNRDKYGLKTIGTEIEIIPEKGSELPDYFLALPWHFIEMFLDKHYEYLKAGGKIVVPLPVPAVYLYENGELKVKKL